MRQQDIKEETMKRLPGDMREVVEQFYEKIAIFITHNYHLYKL